MAHDPAYDEAAHHADADRLIAEWMPWLRREALARSPLRSMALRATPYVCPDGWPPPDWPPRFVLEDIERAYRRGYLHGYGFALDDASSPMRRKAAIGFYNDALYRWRYGTAMSRIDPPRFAGGHQSEAA